MIILESWCSRSVHLVVTCFFLLDSMSLPKVHYAHGLRFTWNADAFSHKTINIPEDYGKTSFRRGTM